MDLASADQIKEPMKIRVCFLDIDGVLNSHEYMRSNRITPAEVGSVIGIDPLLAQRLNRLILEGSVDGDSPYAAIPVEVVVSSTKRQGRTRAQLAEMLKERGFRWHVLGMTPDHVRPTPGGIWTAPERGNEIQAWLEAAPRYGIDVESFCILDDDSDMAHLLDRHIKTMFETGLTDTDVDRAVKMLREPRPLLILPNSENV